MSHRGLWVNEHGELVVETELGPVKFTKPIAYQMIDGKRVEVECTYTIADCGMQNAECEEIGPQNTQKHTKEGFLRPFAVFRGLSEILNPKLVLDFNRGSETQSPKSTNSDSTNPKSKIVNRKSEYGFKVASYDKTKDLVIDPLLQSTFLGGNDWEASYAIAVHPTTGDVYITGYTTSLDLPGLTGGADITLEGNKEAFIARFSGDLETLYQTTYLGGSGEEVCNAIAINPTTGDVYVTGYTTSTDLPGLTNGADITFAGHNEAFVVRLPVILQPSINPHFSEEKAMMQVMASLFIQLVMCM